MKRDRDGPRKRIIKKHVADQTTFNLTLRKPVVLRLLLLLLVLLLLPLFIEYCISKWLQQIWQKL
jgi:hypothetical protein